MRGKKGWIRIVEAVVALLIITGSLMIAITGGHLKKDISEKVYETELTILREISKDQAMRESIITIDEDKTPTSWEDFDTLAGLPEIKTKINSRIPSYLECKARICALDMTCEILMDNNKDIYARSIAVTATSESYNPKQLKLFCWEKT